MMGLAATCTTTAAVIEGEHRPEVCVRRDGHYEGAVKREASKSARILQLRNSVGS